MNQLARVPCTGFGRTAILFKRIRWQRSEYGCSHAAS